MRTADPLKASATRNRRQVQAASREGRRPPLKPGSTSAVVAELQQIRELLSKAGFGAVPVEFEVLERDADGIKRFRVVPI